MRGIDALTFGADYFTRQLVIRELRMKLTMRLSSVSRSLENRDRILPKGVVSKKDCGVLITFDRRQSCIRRAARNTPKNRRHTAEYREMAR